MSLTSYFLSSHVKFMSEQAILIPGQTPPGDSRFQFVPQGEHAALLLLTTQTEKIQGYYVHPIANNNVYSLPSQQRGKYYMFTDAMNGCQFLAYGPDRQHITVEHNNYISYHDNYITRLNFIKEQQHNYFFHLSAGGNDIPNGLYNSLQGINIVGEYTTINGWRFWVRDHVDLNKGSIYGPF
ncbi:TPA: hypothetical protein OF519_005169 [Escherichia coli]|nr:hypothetical protein [Escherichia coli]EGM7142004.1 hypothetical protein [Escherichia coli]EHE7480674.1 hypothetical protein [Escherichia coli]EJH8505848.1 hypothetical protein [Escherichia coli]EKY7025481.1 hypothetical protein [Escherichia coli]